MHRVLTILAPIRYPGLFNSPRHSRHKIERRRFIPFNKISRAFEGVTFFNPFPLRRFDLLHAFNRIPLGPTPFIINFESHLPRAFGHENSAWFRFCASRLAKDKCRRIIAISNYARGHFIKQHENSPHRDKLLAKLEVRYPNMKLPARGDDFDLAKTNPIRMVFVGNHFARKGGCVAIRIAELATTRGLPIVIEIVSALEMGSVSWVDPTRHDFFDRYCTSLKNMPNIINHGALPNDQTVALMKQMHFLLLPTFSDTFGYSAIEAMANYTPVIATDQGALPEFITDGQNGILLPLEKTAQGEWMHIHRHDRHTKDYEELFTREVDRLAELTLEKIVGLVSSDAYRAMRENARATAEALFSEEAANKYWDALYEQIVP